MNLLLVDDEPIILRTLDEILRRNGFAVQTAPSAQAASKAICGRTAGYCKSTPRGVLGG